MPSPSHSQKRSTIGKRGAPASARWWSSRAEVRAILFMSTAFESVKTGDAPFKVAQAVTESFEMGNPPR
jgi:hypothetical protein